MGNLRSPRRHKVPLTMYLNDMWQHYEQQCVYGLFYSGHPVQCLLYTISVYRRHCRIPHPSSRTRVVASSRYWYQDTRWSRYLLGIERQNVGHIGGSRWPGGDTFASDASGRVQLPDAASRACYMQATILSGWVKWSASAICMHERTLNSVRTARLIGKTL